MYIINEKETIVKISEIKMAYYGNTASLLSTVAENKFSHFLNTVLTLWINPCVIKKAWPNPLYSTI